VVDSIVIIDRHISQYRPEPMLGPSFVVALCSGPRENVGHECASRGMS